MQKENIPMFCMSVSVHVLPSQKMGSKHMTDFDLWFLLLTLTHINYVKLHRNSLIESKLRNLR